MQRTVQLYLLVVGLAGLGLLLILYFGSHLPAPGLPQALGESQPSASPVSSDTTSLGGSVEHRLLQNAEDPLSRFFLRLFVVIVVSNAVGRIFTRCGQPAVVGEMMAGILLGPSLFGLLAPNAFQFVFAVGMEMDWEGLRQKASTAILISHASIAVPSLFGAGLAFLFYDHLAQPGVPFVPFALFVAISMSITAFPVLMWILQDRGILKTPLGRIASACSLRAGLAQGR